MIDHILGRPSTRFRKYQVFAVVLFWSFYLRKAPKNGPPGVNHISKWLSRRFSLHQAVVIFCVLLYVTRNFARVVGLESPEPLASLYDRSFFRATWITTALDAGFWTAMHLRPAWLRRTCEIAFTVYYLVCAEQADEMVRRVRGALNVQHLRVSWNKPNSPVLAFFTRLMRPKFMKYEPQKIRIHRPAESDYDEPVDAWLYFDGDDSELRRQDKIVLDIPGGGFVAMDPRCHDDKLLAWAGKLGIPVLALDYKKAPEHPYPYALNECHDVYYQLLATRGRCIGLSGENVPRVIVAGDSAGGNLAIAMTLMILDAQSPYQNWRDGPKLNLLPPPDAVVGIYPALEMNIGNWISDEQLSLLKAPERRKQNKSILDRKTEDYQKLTPNTPYASDDEDDDEQNGNATKRKTSTRGDDSLHPRLKTRLAMSSIISYFNDRIISPEMLRAMILLYIGEHNRPDFSTEFLLSPVRAPEELLAKFPRMFLMCGERDPLVDDTAIFAGRVRQAKLLEYKRRQELGLEAEDGRFDDRQHVEVHFVPGVSHGFLQFVSVFPKAWQYIHLCSRWMRKVFTELDAEEPLSTTATPAPAPAVDGDGKDYFTQRRSHSRRVSASNSDAEKPLELHVPGKLRMTKIDTHTGPRRQSGSGAMASSSASGSRRRARVRSGRMSPADTRTIVHRLASHEDLLARRMNNMTAGLVGDPKPEPDDD